MGCVAALEVADWVCWAGDGGLEGGGEEVVGYVGGEGGGGGGRHCDCLEDL